MTNFVKKLWSDRRVEFPNRKEITNDTTGEVTQATITRDEGEVLNPGDKVDALNMNDLEDRIAASVNSKSEVTVTPSQSSGNKIADIVVNGDTKTLYAPTSGLPSVSPSDAGKVLQVSNQGAWIADVFEGLPTVTSADVGKILIVDQNGDWEIDVIPNQLPTVTSADEGKLLQVNSSGQWVAVDLDGNNDEF